MGENTQVDTGRTCTQKIPKLDLVLQFCPVSPPPETTSLHHCHPPHPPQPLSQLHSPLPLCQYIPVCHSFARLLLFFPFHRTFQHCILTLSVYSHGTFQHLMLTLSVPDLPVCSWSITCLKVFFLCLQSLLLLFVCNPTRVPSPTSYIKTLLFVPVDYQ